MLDLATITALLQLGWPAIVMIIAYVLWRENQSLKKELIDCYRDHHDEAVEETRSPS